MRSTVSALIAASLLWVNGPLPAWGSVVVRNAAPAAVGSISGAQAGALAVLQGPLAPDLTPGAGSGILSAGSGSVLLSPAAPAWTPGSPRSAAAPRAALAAPSAAATPALPVSRRSRTAVAPETAPEAGREEPGGAVTSGAAGASLHRFEKSRETKETRGPCRYGPAATVQEDVLRTHGRSEDPAVESSRLGTLFDGNTVRKLEEGTPVETAPETGALRKTALRLVAGKDVAGRAAATAPTQPGTKEDQGKLPGSYYLYLVGQILYALGQEASTLIAPLYAYAQQGLAFAVAGQVVDLVSIIPGSMLGGWLVKKFGSKKVYLAANLVHAVSFLSVPLAFLATGSFSTVHFMVFKVLSGLIYGTLRGVAEKEIAPRIVGQENMDRLKKAGSMFYAAFEVAELTAAIVTTALIASMGLNGSSLIMGLVMLTSVIPISFIKFRSQGPVDDSDGEAGTEKKLPLALYLPFIFSVCVHILLYQFLAPFFALELFHAEALTAQLIGFYTFGSLAVALLMTYLPKLSAKLSERGWSAVGILSALAFLWGTLALQIPALTLGLAAVLGVGLTGMQIQWRAVYQKRLAMEVQPNVFKWLSIGGILAALIPSAVIQAGMLLSVPMPFLLTLVAAGLTAAALGVPLALKLWQRLRGTKDRKPA
ncbi:MAG: hypothetical protein A2X36_01620 [Elusimicrobia bacterium GWA2_69_24]|nr:MAG: hypothetical protein A2X36_01620 [Elusimicrobia bacterium GWA2_69_24]HBL19140.1 hypothetical protein [Elusimicrobiota bacterium]